MRIDVHDEARTELIEGKPVGRRARSLPVSGWPYSIIYQAKPDHIFIVAIAHHSRRPNYWRPRLR